jgi:hypothetical protein
MVKVKESMVCIFDPLQDGERRQVAHAKRFCLYLLVLTLSNYNFPKNVKYSPIGPNLIIII